MEPVLSTGQRKGESRRLSIGTVPALSDGTRWALALPPTRGDAAKVPVTLCVWWEQAVKENHTHMAHLEALLAMESEERDRHAVAHRLHDAWLPRMKTLKEFEFAWAPQTPATKIRELAEGGWSHELNR